LIPIGKDIIAAIQSKKVLSFSYGAGKRDVEPFCYGVHKSSGNEVLRGYQTGGFSESGNGTGWRLFKVAEISRLSITEKGFTGVRHGYTLTTL
jgi:predicted DNA-binding transcriptional regulator YafY